MSYETINLLNAIFICVKNGKKECKFYKYNDEIIQHIDFFKNYYQNARDLYNLIITNYFDELKNNNRILVNIYKKINNKYFNKDKFSEEDIQSKINNWFKKNNSDDFHLDLTE